MLAYLILMVTTTPILQLGRLRLRERVGPAQGHTARGASGLGGPLIGSWVICCPAARRTGLHCSHPTALRGLSRCAPVFAAFRPGPQSIGCAPALTARPSLPDPRLHTWALSRGPGFPADSQGSPAGKDQSLIYWSWSHGRAVPSP